MGGGYASVLATLPYAFSPFVLGIVGDANPDSAAMYYMVIFIACSLYKYEWLELIFAICFVFTKEPAIIYYTAYIAAKIVGEYLYNHSFRLMDFVKCAVCNIKNYIYALPIIGWLLLYLLNPNGAWGSGSSIGHFGVDAEVLAMKLKQIFCLNFNWLFWLLIIIALVGCIISKIKIEKNILRDLFPICIMLLSVIAFNCLYSTFTHARYIAPMTPLLYLTVTALATKLGNKTIVICNILISVLLLIQSFYAIDPVMNKIFPWTDTGSGKIYRLQAGGMALADGIVYNCQYVYLSETISLVLEDSGYNGDMQIVLPDEPLCTEYDLFGGIGLWDTQRKKRVNYNSNIEWSKQGELIKVCQISGLDYALERVYKGKYILYIVPEWANVDTDFILYGETIKEGRIEHKGYNIRYWVMDIEDRLCMNNKRYVIVPKGDDTGLALCTDGLTVSIGEEALAKTITLQAVENRYKLIFDEYQIAVKFPDDVQEDNGTIWVEQQLEDSEHQEWTLRSVGDYFMICHGKYAQTYNLEDCSVKLNEAVGDENQLWRFEPID